MFLFFFAELPVPTDVEAYVQEDGVVVITFNAVRDPNDYTRYLEVRLFRISPPPPSSPALPCC